MKIAVIGVGGVGSAAARFAAQAGHDVVGFEQFRIGHTRGSSHGESRIIRYTYPDLLYTQMMADAYPLWAKLEQAAGEELFVRCGGILFGPRAHPRVRGTLESLQAASLPFEVLEPEAARERFPAFALRLDEVALFQASSGFLRATPCLRANARLARQAGADLREESPVLDIAAHGDQALVRTASGTEVFDRVIVTAGAWMGKLLCDLKLPLCVEQRQIMYLATKGNGEQFEPQAMPVWIDAMASYYGFPSDGRVPGIKLASHVNGYSFDPDHPDRPVVEENVRHAVDYAHTRFPDATDTVFHAQACLYTVTPDEHFILDQVPGLNNVWLVSGCSGHGFKFTVLLGKIAADLAAGKPYGRDLSRFRLNRFSC